MNSPDQHPIVMWELTRACDLHCLHCPGRGAEGSRAEELSTYESYKTVDEIALLTPREVIITGGDPLERGDVTMIIEYARRRGLDPALVVSPTTRLTWEAVVGLARRGLTTMSFSIDGSTPEIHQSGHGVAGTFLITLLGMRWARTAGLSIEINTLVSRRNKDDIPAIAALIRQFRPKRWNVHFLVPTGSSAHVQMLTAGEVESVFGLLAQTQQNEDFDVRVVEAPHYRRYLFEQSLLTRSAGACSEDSLAPITSYVPPNEMAKLMDAAIGGAESFMFISHAGDVRVSEFLPIRAGNVRYRPLGDIFRGADLFVAVRDAANLRGRCGECEFRTLCGGSRARAWAMSGNMFSTDPLCAYVPGALQVETSFLGRYTIPL